MRPQSVMAAARLLSVLIPLALPVASHAQAGRIDLPSFDDLAQKATNSVNISLDPSLLRLAAQFVGSGQDADAAQSVLNGIEGIYVRSFDFAADHAYPQSEVEPVRKQIEAAGWAKLVSIHHSEQNEDVDIRVRRQGNHIEGLVVIVTNPRHFTIVNIVGSVDLAKLSALQGKFGVPSLPQNVPPGRKPSGS